MPADPSHDPVSRRASRKLAGEDASVTDLKRARGEISCAECRRLKLRCDKRLPCSSCIRRGCPSICPNGSLSSQGTRFVLADTLQLHTKIAEMGQRIRQLEDALAIFQSGISSETHPLLREELLAVKFGPEKSPATMSNPRESFADSIDALGTLTIGDNGEGKYFGRSAGSETLFLAGADLIPSADDEEILPLSLEIARLSNSFPFSPSGDLSEALAMLYDYLPEQRRAWSLCETYTEHGAWLFRPISREEIVDDIMTPIYKNLKEMRAEGIHSVPNPVSPHKMAVLFIIFSLGALLDLTLDPYTLESDNYFNLCRAALSLRSIFDSPEIATVQAVLLLASYHSSGGRRYMMDASWTLMSLGSKLGQSLGLHRDSARWNMDPKTVLRRRALFWEFYIADLFHSLALGRPPSIQLSYVDCELPDCDEATLDQNGDAEIGFYRWKYEFTRDIFAPIIERTLTAESPSYETILELDRMVREKMLPPHLNFYMSIDDANCTPTAYMRGCLLGHYRTIAILYIHRTFFAQAMLDYPANPLRSPYAPSFLAAYRCASGVIQANLNHFKRFPELCGRWWMIWNHLFTAAIVVGVIVTRSPSLSMAANAYVELGLACDLFEKGALHSRRAKSGLAILRKLREKAFHVFSQFRTGNPLSTGLDLDIARPDYGEDELAIFGGQTRVLVSKLISDRHKQRKPSMMSSTTTHHTPSPDPSETDPHFPIEYPIDIHPSVIDFLSNLPPSQHPPDAQTGGFLGQISQLPSDHLLPPLQPEAQAYPMFDQDPTGGTSAVFDDVRFASSEYAALEEHSDSPFGDLADHESLMGGASSIDEQWRSFMRQAGLLDENA